MACLVQLPESARQGKLARAAGHSVLLKSAYAAHGREAPYTVCSEGAAASGDFMWFNELLDVASTVDMVSRCQCSQGASRVCWT